MLSIGQLKKAKKIAKVTIQSSFFTPSFKDYKNPIFKIQPL